MRYFLLLPFLISILLLPSAFAQSTLTIDSDSDFYDLGEVVMISGVAPVDKATLQIKDPTGKTILIRTVLTDSGKYVFKFNLNDDYLSGKYILVISAMSELIPIVETKTITINDKIIQNVDIQEKSSKEGGCLIATATYGSEMALEVQQLRELRDNQLLQTESGTAFMGMFNDAYYTFSPYIADMERENPVFKEVVKMAITPMIFTLSLMENAETESEVLGIGISVIALNLGMYLGVPAVVIFGIRKRVKLIRFD
jgi:hypothetical protein